MPVWDPPQELKVYPAPVVTESVPEPVPEPVVTESVPEV